jgi:DNA-binding HxlR family transcriptional regulator
MGHRRRINYYYDSHLRTLIMQRKRFNTMTCPIARGLDRVGEWWSILILRDACNGTTRFDVFQQSPASRRAC